MKHYVCFDSSPTQLNISSDNGSITYSDALLEALNSAHIQLHGPVVRLQCQLIS